MVFKGGHMERAYRRQQRIKLWDISCFLSGRGRMEGIASEFGVKSECYVLEERRLKEGVITKVLEF